jgi:hypothetical protein
MKARSLLLNLRSMQARKVPIHLNVIPIKMMATAFPIMLPEISENLIEAPTVA